MFGNLGFTELIFIFVIALIFFGPRKLPELGKSLGETLGQFKRASEDFKRSWEEEVEVEKKRKPAEAPRRTEVASILEPNEPEALPAPVITRAEGTVAAVPARPEVRRVDASEIEAAVAAADEKTVDAERAL